MGTPVEFRDGELRVTEIAAEETGMFDHGQGGRDAVEMDLRDFDAARSGERAERADQDLEGFLLVQGAGAPGAFCLDGLCGEEVLQPIQGERAA